MGTEKEHHFHAEDAIDGVANIRRCPSDSGVVELIVRRPASSEREVLQVGTLSVSDGLEGDHWAIPKSSGSQIKMPSVQMQVTLMNARAAELIAGTQDQWPLAGDQFYVDFDLSDENLPPGARLMIGDATVEVTSEPHLGCGKFAARFGVDALKFVNSDVGRQLNVRGINARVINPGVVRTADAINKLLDGVF